MAAAILGGEALRRGGEDAGRCRDVSAAGAGGGDRGESFGAAMGLHGGAGRGGEPEVSGDGMGMGQKTSRCLFVSLTAVLCSARRKRRRRSWW